MKESFKNIDADDIAIIGMAGCFPKAGNIFEFWNNLIEGRECISFYTDEELEASGVPFDLYNNPQYVKASGSIEDIEYFDAAFFKYSHREASLIDPQQRLFLEQAWKALEDANCNPDTYRGLIGVYASTGMNTYLHHNLQSHGDIMRESNGYHVMIASDKDFLATRTSYKLNLKGPSLTIQTACSSSLVAIHTACQALKCGECDMALAGGVSLRVPQKSGYLFQDGMILSPDGHCRPFDSRARGTVIGNGIGIIVLKMLTEALRNGDSVYAVIKGSAINNDGSLKAGYTAPGLNSQTAVIHEAMCIAGIKPEQISYVETHGTGTALGDPIEITALTNAFKTGNIQPASCAIGSVKSNIGHLDTAAGVTGIIKTALALKYGKIPASLNFETPNPKIDFTNSPFYVNTILTPWITNGSPRYAGVSSFGIGGTNAHVILQEAPVISEVKKKSEQRYYIVNLSAKTDSTLHRKAEELSICFVSNSDMLIEDAAFTLATCRKTMDHRLSFLCTNKEEAVSILKEPEAHETFRGTGEKTDREVAFVFPGQGTSKKNTIGPQRMVRRIQYENMGRDLYDSEKVFRETMDECFAIFKQLLGIDLKEIIYPNPRVTESSEYQLNSTLYTQTAIFIIEYSLAKLLISWGIIPKYMAGHGIGEYTAACLAGVFTLGEALQLVVELGKLVNTLPESNMLSVELPEPELIPLLPKETSLSAVNGAAQCVVSGPPESITTLQQNLIHLGINVKLLNVSHTFHSTMLDPILPSFRSVLNKIRLHPPKIPFVSTCTGQWISDTEAIDPEYWVKHLRQTVRFFEAAEKLMEISDMALLEVGPGKALSSLMCRHPVHDRDRLILNTLPHPAEKTDSVKTVYEALSRLWVYGAIADWKKFYENDYHNLRKVRLPVYSFDKKLCWIEPSGSQKAADSPYYTPVFRKTAGAYPLPETVPVNNYIVFLDHNPFPDKLVQGLKSRGHHVITVQPDQAYRKESESSFFLPKSGQEEYALFFGEIEKQSIYFNRIIYLWGLDDPGNENQHFLNILTLVRFTSMSRIKFKIRLTLILRKLIDISGCEEIIPGIQSLVGLHQAVPREYPNIRFQIIDTGLLEYNNQINDNTNRIIQDIEGPGAETLIVYRDRTRWVHQYEQLDLRALREKNSRIQKDKTILLLNLSGLMNPDVLQGFQEDNKIHWLAADKNIKDSTDKGIISTDLADPEDVQRLREYICNSGSVISDIIYNPVKISAHANETIKEFNDAAFRINIGRFIKEINNINDILGTLHPEFITILGGGKRLGIENYWLEGQILSLVKHEHYNWRFLDYDYNTHQNLKMTFIRLIQDVLITEIPEFVIISDRNPLEIPDETFINDSDEQQREKISFDTRPALANTYMPPRNEIDKTLVKIWEAILGVRPVGISDNFFELGGTSLMITRIITGIRKEFQLESITVNEVYENPTIQYLADYIGAVSPVNSLEMNNMEFIAYEEGEF